MGLSCREGLGGVISQEEGWAQPSICFCLTFDLCRKPESTQGLHLPGFQGVPLDVFNCQVVAGLIFQFPRKKA